MNFLDMLTNGINYFFTSFFEDMISTFSQILASIMGTSENVLELEFVKNGIKYTQILALALLIVKVMNEAFQTYTLYVNGDPDSDPAGLLIRTGQSIAIIAVMPWILEQIFTMGMKMAKDVASLGTGSTGIEDLQFLTELAVGSAGISIILFLIIIVIIIIIIAIQSTIRGGKLALMAVVGSIMALNLTSNNRSLWSGWVREVIVICSTQALQIFLLQGALRFMTSGIVSDNGLILIIGWLWVTMKTPKYLQSLVDKTGFTGAVGGAIKQASSMAIMRKFITK